MFQPKSRVRYTPTSGPARPAVILHKVNDLDAYHIRTSTGQRVTVPASQLTTKTER